MHSHHDGRIHASEAGDAHVQIGGCDGDEAGQLLAAARERIEVAANAEEAAFGVDQHGPDFRPDRAFGREIVEFLGEPAIERIAALRLIERDVRDAFPDLEGECRQLHRTRPWLVSQRAIAASAGLRRGAPARLGFLSRPWHSPSGKNSSRRQCAAKLVHYVIISLRSASRTLLPDRRRTIALEDPPATPLDNGICGKAG